MIIFPAVPPGPITRLDPRLRVVAAVLLAVTTSFTQNWTALTCALVFSLVLAALARIAWWRVGRVALSLNFFLLLLWLALPASVEPGGGFGWRSDLAGMGLVIVLRANAILFLVAALLGTMEPVFLGAALDRLRVPSRFSQTFLFMIRYIEVIHEEYHRLRDAIAVRAFRPRWNRHTLRSFGYIFGMLFVRSFDRAERIRDAMKCRGFDGRYHVLYPFRLAARDAIFATGVGLWFVLQIALEIRSI